MSVSVKSVYCTALAALCFLFGLTPAPAAFVHDLTVTERFAFSGNGRIEFSALSGNSAIGVTAFSFSGRFTGSVFGNPVDETFDFNSPSQILNIDWSIDPITSALTLNLGTILVPGSVTPGQYCILLQNDGAGGNCGGILNTTLSFSRAARFQTGSTGTSLGDLSTTAVHQQVPEPAAMSLFGVGLVGLGLAAAQRRRRASR